ncbi:hypothetical protein HDU96_005007, partial [Phlyctochytrium bullatum]
MAHRSAGLPDPVRHFALSLLEHAVQSAGAAAVKGSFGNLAAAAAGGKGGKGRSTGVATEALRPWNEVMKPVVVDLVVTGTGSLTEEKPYIKEKVVRVFVEAAKRFWPHHWVDMDRLLRQQFFSDVSLFVCSFKAPNLLIPPRRAQPKSQDLILAILRTLSEDIYILEDDAATLRKKDLTPSMSAIFFNADLLQALYTPPPVPVGGAPPPQRKSAAAVLAVDLEAIVKMIRGAEGGDVPGGNEVGWIKILAGTVVEHHARWGAAQASGNLQEAAAFHSLTVEALRTIAAAYSWIPP